MVWTGQQPAGIARQSRSAQESGKPRSHGSDLGPPVSGVAGAIFEWSLGCDPFRQLCGWSQLCLAFGKGGAEGGLVRVLKQAEPLRTTGTGARGHAGAGGAQGNIGEAIPTVGARTFA